MPHAEFFLILPEYDSARRKTSSLLQKLDVANTDLYVNIYERLQDFNEFFTHEDSYEVFYDSLNIIAHLCLTEVLDEYYPHINRRYREVLYNYTDWRKAPSFDNADQFAYCLSPIREDTFCEAAKRKVLYGENTYAFLRIGVLDGMNSPIAIDINGREVSVDHVELNVGAVSNWFANDNRRPDRVYVWNSKHGEYGVGAHKDHAGEKVSVLLGSRFEAADLLKHAIGKHPFDGYLYYFDTKYNHYMEFKSGTGNTYHSYHLDLSEERSIELRLRRKIQRLVPQARV